MGRTLRAAIVGTGYAGERHLLALRQIEGVEFRAIVASTAQRATEAGRAFGLRAVVGYADVLEDPQVDVVHVCTPNYLHAAIASAALRAGKHVLCEKPLALDVEQGLALAELAAASGRLAIVCHNYRFYPLVVELRARVQAGELGALHAVRGSFLQTGCSSRPTVALAYD